MHGPKRLLLLIALLCVQACSHGRAVATQGREDSPAGAAEEGVRIKGNSLNARIAALIARGEFAEAQMLIAEGTAAGSLSQPSAQRLLDKIALLNTKLSEVPASLQRVRDFPSQLKDYTLFQIRSMLDAKDFRIATQAQLHMATKLIEQETRLMSKAQ
jgi:hypothetical protein